MAFIPSEDIELSQEERITLAQARWNEATAANEKTWHTKKYSYGSNQWSKGYFCTQSAFPKT